MVRSETRALKAAEAAFEASDSLAALAALEAADKAYFAAVATEKARIAALNASDEEALDAEVNAHDTDGTKDDELFRLEMVAVSIETARAGL